MGEVAMDGFARWKKAFLAVSMLVVIAAGMGFYFEQQNRLKIDIERQLASIARLKTGQIRAWCDERVSDANVLAEDPVFLQNTAQWFSQADARTEELIRARLENIRKRYKYDDILLADQEGLTRFSLIPTLTGTHTEIHDVIDTVFSSGKPVLAGPRICPALNQPHIVIAAPLWDFNQTPPKPIGAVFLVQQARRFLYPLVQSWPIATKTAETLLVMREGNAVLFLNDLRHRPGAALHLRIPLTQTHVPAVMAVLGREGVVEGEDYRGEKVLSALQSIPGSSWRMVAKIDAREAFAQWHYEAALILFLFVALLGLAGVFGFFLKQRSEKRQYRRMYIAEAALRNTEARYGAMLHSIGEGVITTDAKGRIELMNPVAESLTGWTGQEAHGRLLEEIFILVNESTGEKLPNLLQKVLNEGKRVERSEHTLLISRNGNEFSVADNAAPIWDEHGRIAGAVIVFRDQSGEHAAWTSLRHEQAMSQQYLDVASVMLIAINASGVITMLNRRGCSMLGCTESEVLGLNWFDHFIPPTIRDEVKSIFADIMDDRLPMNEYVENLIITHNGEERLIAWRNAIIRNEEGKIIATLSSGEDITDRRRAENELAIRLRQQAAIAQLGQVALSGCPLDELFEAAIQQIAGTLEVEYVKILEKMPDGKQLLLRAGTGWNEGLAGHAMVSTDPDSQAGYTLESRTPVVVADLTQETRFNGPPLLFEHQVISGVSTIIGAPETPYGVLGAHTAKHRIFSSDDVLFLSSVANILAEVIDLQKAEHEVIKVAREWQSTFDAANSVIWILDENNRIVRTNRAVERFFQQSPESCIGRYCWEVAHGGKGACPDCPAERAQKTCRRASMELHRGENWFDITVDPILDEQRKYVSAVHIVTDITERKAAEKEREELQEQLRQSQRLESIGRLAGGVAHDFNNMLGVILGHSELALEQVEKNSSVYDDIIEIQKAADRSAALTRQLLAFARKQTVSPKVLNINEIIEGMLKMLRRLIGEDIELIWVPAPDVWLVKIDPAQIDQILANLCVNARDAIVGVGQITIETGNVDLDENYCTRHPDSIPNQYVMIAISDSGCGMSKDILEHVFEPFFTTKGMGRGTGLGLATVYGIAKQNEGFINVYSEPGKGSTFRIYLPRTAEAPSSETLNPVAIMPHSKGETVLLVEDEEALLNLTKSMLSQLGYHTLTAQNPEEAIQCAHTHIGPIHVLLTDVVMPGMNGRQLSAQLNEMRPGMRTLFMSGYTANVIAHQGVLDPDVHFIAKPFSLNALANKLREAIEMDLPQSLIHN